MIHESRNKNYTSVDKSIPKIANSAFPLLINIIKVQNNQAVIERECRKKVKWTLDFLFLRKTIKPRAKTKIALTRGKKIYKIHILRNNNFIFIF